MHFRNRRSAVTLMEVLIVIAIVAILSALVMVAIMGSRDRGKEFETRMEIQRLESRLHEFKLAYRFYPPSQIRLCERLSDYTTSEVDTRSLEILNGMFDPKMWNAGLIDWDGDGVYSPPVMLTGDQCLVFFLGGVPVQTVPGVRGFAPGRNPTAGTGTPLFNFDRHRLVKVRNNNFYSYKDPYDRVPYAYFSGSKLGYNAWTTLAPTAYAFDCPNLPGGAMNGTDVSPYQSAPGTFHQPDSFQIMSAGKDGVFGPGGSVLPRGAGPALPASAQDDLTNFSTGRLRGF